jgi:hypothetical protein
MAASSTQKGRYAKPVLAEKALLPSHILVLSKRPEAPMPTSLL